MGSCGENGGVTVFFLHVANGFVPNTVVFGRFEGPVLMFREECVEDAEHHTQPDRGLSHSPSVMCVCVCDEERERERGGLRTCMCVCIC